jgi:hypothetical protein
MIESNFGLNPCKICNQIPKVDTFYFESILVPGFWVVGCPQCSNHYSSKWTLKKPPINVMRIAKIFPKLRRQWNKQNPLPLKIRIRHFINKLLYKRGRLP